MAQMMFVVSNLKVRKMSNEEFIERFYNPDDPNQESFNEIVYERQIHKNALRQRIKKYYLSDDEIDNLFKIIDSAEIEIEKIKRNQDYTKCSREDLVKISKKIASIQEKMRADFESKLKIAVKKKAELIQKIYMRKKEQKEQEK